LKPGGSNRAAGLAILVIGLVIGAGLFLTLDFTYDVLTPRTITTTWTVTSIVVITLPTVITTTTVYSRVNASATACQWSGSQEYCQVVLENSGSSGTATTGNCTLSYGGYSYEGHTGPTTASATPPGAPQQLIPGNSVTAYCQSVDGRAAGSGAQIIGFIPLADGTEASFSATASS